MDRARDCLIPEPVKVSLTHILREDDRFGLLLLGADGLRFRGVVGCQTYQPGFLRGTVF